MSSPSVAEEQLLELLLQLKRTTPDAARQILNSQAQIAYALITLMVGMDAINTDVFQKILAAYGEASAPPPAAPPAPAIPPHVQTSFRGATPPGPPAFQQYPAPLPPQSHVVPPPHAPQAPHGYPSYPSYPSYPPPAPAPAPPYGAPPGPLADVLANIPDDQKAMIMRVVTMTPEHIAQLGPSERASVLQLRATLGIP